MQSLNDAYQAVSLVFLAGVISFIVALAILVGLVIYQVAKTTLIKMDCLLDEAMNFEDFVPKLKD